MWILNLKILKKKKDSNTQCQCRRHETGKSYPFWYSCKHSISLGNMFSKYSQILGSCMKVNSGQSLQKGLEGLELYISELLWKWWNSGWCLTVNRRKVKCTIAHLLCSIPQLSKAMVRPGDTVCYASTLSSIPGTFTFFRKPCVSQWSGIF